MSRTTVQQITKLSKCVNKICLKQHDIIKKQNYIIESNGWDRNCDPVCFTISGPVGENNSFLMTGGGTRSKCHIWEHGI